MKGAEYSTRTAAAMAPETPPSTNDGDRQLQPVADKFDFTTQFDAQAWKTGVFGRERVRETDVTAISNLH
jgi:hypothetical protein